MKRLIAVFIMICLLAACASCGRKPDPNTDPDLNRPGENMEELPEESSTVVRESAVYGIIKKRAYDYNFDQMTAIEFAANLGLGWNLGNTLDATGGEGQSPIAQETSWGNPETTQGLIKAVADYGFTTLRIPITWYNFVDSNNNIDEAFLERVKQIVDWAIDEGLFVIINTHHETDWLKPTEADYPQVSEKLCRMWEQIGNYFADYDERLVFEAMNEPRVEDDWNGNYRSQSVVNKLGNDFVTTVRGLGGNNATRFLMVPCYAATSNSDVWKHYKMPDDERVILSVHAYLPYDFALNIYGTDKWRGNSHDTRDIDNLFSGISSVLHENGIACVIGEFGCMSKNGNLEDRIACTQYFAEKAAEAKVPIMWWDNNAFYEGETFGLIRRGTNVCEYPGIIEAMFNAWYGADIKFGEE